MAGIDPKDSDLPTSRDLVLDGSGALRGRSAEGTRHSLGRIDIRNCLDPKESIRGSDYNPDSKLGCEDQIHEFGSHHSRAHL